jgi:hypothetical protein
MQSNDYKELENNLSSSLIEKLQGLASVESRTTRKEVIQQSVAEEFKKMTEEQKIYSLSADEVQLVIDFRKWGSGNGSASGVFHWRKQYGIKWGHSQRRSHEKA